MGAAGTGASGAGGTVGTAGAAGTATAGTAGVGGKGGAAGTSAGGLSGTGGGAAGASGAAGVSGAAGTAAGGRGGTSGAAGASGTTGTAGAGGAAGQTAPVTQTTQGAKAALTLLDNFDGIPGNGDPSDPSLAVGPNHIVQVVNWQLAVYTKKGAMYGSTGMSLKGPVASNSIFSGFGGRCEGMASGADATDRGDMLVRYDQLAGRWVFIQPVFSSPYAMCYAVSTTGDPLGSYARYEFARAEFPDYPRLGVWPDGYYVTTSAGDTVVQKRVCVADRTKMLAGQAATEQCVGKSGVNFLNPADLDGTMLPPSGAPNILLAAGGTQLQSVYSDDGIYVYKMHVDWTTPSATTLTGPTKITVASYNYLCNGQLTSCVPQQGTTTKLDAQGDKLMQRLAYRNFGDHQSLVITHSINGPSTGGGVRWYEFRVDAAGNVTLYQQSTFVPDASYRWLASAAMDSRGDIGIGYSFGDASSYPGQRFAARSAADPLGTLGFHESVVAAGQAAQISGLRWEDFSTTVIDPSDDATFWYMGDYYKSGAKSRSIHIGSFRVP